MALFDMMNLLGIGLAGGLIMFVIGVLAFIFWIAMLIDGLKRKFKNDTEKIVWILVLIFTYILGALIYYFIVKHKQ